MHSHRVLDRDPANAPPGRPIRGVCLKLASVAVIMAMTGLIKATAEEVPAGEAVFFRSVFALPLLILWLMSKGQFLRSLRTERPFAHLWRGIFGACGMTCGFIAIGLLPLPEVIAIGFAQPIFAVLFAVLLLGERISTYRMLTISLGVLGVSIIVAPHLTIFDFNISLQSATFGVIAELMSAAFLALAQVSVRRLTVTETTVSIVFYYSLTTMVFSAVTVLFGWVLPSTPALIMLILAGILGGLGQILLTESFRYAEVSLIAPLTYSEILFAIFIGYFFFGETPTWLILSGATITILAGLLLVRGNRR